MANQIDISMARVATASPQQRPRLLRQAVQEVVGEMFYAPMLQMARQSPFKSRLGHGGRGEDIFGAQLDMELAKRVARATSSSLVDAVYDNLSRGCRE